VTGARLGRRALASLVAAVGAMLLLASGAHAQDPVVAAAGDIACDPESEFFNNGQGIGTNCRQMLTSDGLVADSSLDSVLVLGDVQYENNEAWKYGVSYNPSWGRVKSITRPAIGNHEYHEGSGNPPGSNYFDYFNGAGNFTGPAGDRDKGYYSFDLGSWHLIALNSMCSEVGGCGPGSPQERWLREDLAANPRGCTLVYSHHPVYSSGTGNYDSLAPLYQAAYDAGAELVLSGHDHNYERFAPQDPGGRADSSFGLRQFVVGTGGKNLRQVLTPKPHSQLRDNTTPGVLKLTLRDDRYEWRWVRNDGSPVGDSGSTDCHGTPPRRAAEAATGRANGIRASSARLNAAVNPQGQETTYHFEYGPTPAYGSSTAPQTLQEAASIPRPVSTELTGLPAGTYHYRVIAENASGRAVGEDRTLTTGEPTGRYAGLVGRRRGLVSHWRLGDAGNGFGFDQRSRSLGVLSRGAALGQPGALVRDGDSAATFDGETGEMSSYDPTVARSATLEGWFIWRQGVALMRDDSFLGGWVLAYEREDGTVGYRVGDASFRTWIDIADVRDGNWHHVALTKAGRRTAFYLDGQRVDTSAGAPSEQATMPWHVMRNGPHPQFSEGQADEVAVYRRALPRSAIEHHYDAGKGLRRRRTARYRPTRHHAASGRTVGRRRSRRRLFANDGLRINVRPARSSGQYVASSQVTTRIRRRHRARLRTLRADVNGGTIPGNAAVSIRAYDVQARRWVEVAKPRGGMRADRTFGWWWSSSPRRFVSRRGVVRIRVVASAAGRFRLALDSVRFVAQY
jgi:hypothetical protein